MIKKNIDGEPNHLLDAGSFEFSPNYLLQNVMILESSPAFVRKYWRLIQPPAKRPSLSDSVSDTLLTHTDIYHNHHITNMKSTEPRKLALPKSPLTKKKTTKQKILLKGYHSNNIIAWLWYTKISLWNVVEQDQVNNANSAFIFIINLFAIHYQRNRW